MPKKQKRRCMKRANYFLSRVFPPDNFAHVITLTDRKLPGNSRYLVAEDKQI